MSSFVQILLTATMFALLGFALVRVELEVSYVKARIHQKMLKYKVKPEDSYDQATSRLVTIGWNLFYLRILLLAVSALILAIILF